MNNFIGSFARMEKKYILNRSIMNDLIEILSPYIQDDEYCRSTINSLYFDTADDKLILRSLEKPYYKEKLRLRTYSGTVKDNTQAFAEIKKKVDGVVYKRRITGSYKELFNWMSGKTNAPNSDQITKEIDYLMSFYGQMRPAMQIVYLRNSFVAKDDNALRITFDTDILWRNWGLNESGDAYGFRLVPENTVLMEVKASCKAIPLWLIRSIEELGIQQSSLSKYGEAYRLTKALEGDVRIKEFDKVRVNNYV